MKSEMLETIEAAIDEVAPIIREQADEAERNRRLTPDTVAAMSRAGLMKGQAPRSLGGLEADPPSWYRALEAMGRVDGSAAWCSFISSGAGLILSPLPDDAVAERILDGPAIVAGAFFPPGMAAATNGGYTVSGRWPFGSGCEHSTSMLSLCVAAENGQPRQGPAGPELRFVTFPTERATILDTWNVSGLTATGSQDFVLEGLYVPETESFPMGSPYRGKHFQSPLYRFPFLHGVGLPMASVALGIASGAIDHALDLARTKVPMGGTTGLRERATFQVQMADAVASYHAGRAWLYQEVEETWEIVQSGAPVSPERRATFLLAAANATRSAAHAVDLAYTACGGTSLYRTSPLQRALRDVHAVTQHIATSPQQFENGVRVLVGLPPLIPLLLL